jgi:hypothetical protein
MGGVRSKTVENAWQFLKVWPEEGGWNEAEAMAAFESDCAIRYPRGRGKKAIGHHWHETGELIDYVEARQRIYLPLYLKMLELPDRAEIIQRLRDQAASQLVSIWDFDSYDIKAVGLTNIFDTIFYEKRPFAHAFIVAIAVRDEIEIFWDYLADKRP